MSAQAAESRLQMAAGFEERIAGLDRNRRICNPEGLSPDWDA